MKTEQLNKMAKELISGFKQTFDKYNIPSNLIGDINIYDDPHLLRSGRIGIYAFTEIHNEDRTLYGSAVDASFEETLEFEQFDDFYTKIRPKVEEASQYIINVAKELWKNEIISVN